MALLLRRRTGTRPQFVDRDPGCPARAPHEEDTALAARQVRSVVERIIAAGGWLEGDPQIWIVADTGYNGPRLAFVLADLPVRVLVRARSDRVMRFSAPARRRGQRGRSARHGAEFAFSDHRTWPDPTYTTTTDTSRYGTATARCWSLSPDCIPG